MVRVEGTPVCVKVPSWALEALGVYSLSLKLQGGLCTGIRSDLPLETVAAAWGVDWKGLQVRQRT